MKTIEDNKDPNKHILRVGQLRAMLEGVGDTLAVVVEDSYGEGAYLEDLVTEGITTLVLSLKDYDRGAYRPLIEYVQSEEDMDEF